MKNKILRIIILTILVISINIVVFANTLNLTITSNKESVKVGDKVKITVSWDKGMQAADFSLKYDSELLEYVKCDLDDLYTNNENSEVKIAWFSDNNKDKNEIEYTFKAIKNGTVELTTKINGGFATGELEIPDKYNNDKLTLKIEGNSSIIKILKIVAIIIIILIVLMLVKRIKSKKRGTKRRDANKR